jgi:choline dehydrogenase-like flavoprotein
MAVDPALGVVDTNLRIHGTSNAYVVGASVFPSMGAANPTFTAMALALRLAEFIDHGTMRPST